MDTSGVYVELLRRSDGGTEGVLVCLDDSPRLTAGAEVTLDGDPDPWTVYSVHRCVERADGKHDHGACFAEWERHEH